MTNFVSVSTVGYLKVSGAPKYSCFGIPLLTLFPGGKDKSKIILNSEESFFGMAFRGELQYFHRKVIF